MRRVARIGLTNSIKAACQHKDSKFGRPKETVMVVDVPSSQPQRGSEPQHKHMIWGPKPGSWLALAGAGLIGNDCKTVASPQTTPRFTALVTGLLSCILSIFRGVSLLRGEGA